MVDLLGNSMETKLIQQKSKYNWKKAFIAEPELVVCCHQVIKEVD